MALTSELLIKTRTDIKDDLEVIFLYGAAGTGNTTPTASDTALESEIFRDSIDSFDKSVADTVTASLRILTTEANGNTIREGGWLSSSSSGSLWIRDTLTAINKTSDINLFLDTSLEITVTDGGSL